MKTQHEETRKPRMEHSVPWFWPFSAAIEFGEEGMRLFQDNLKFLTETQRINAPPAPEWATSNRIDLELDTMRLRDFSIQRPGAGATSVLIDPPYAGHSSSIADYAKGQSLVEALRAAGHDHIYVLRQLLPAHAKSTDVLWSHPIPASPAVFEGLTCKHVPVCPRPQADTWQAHFGRR